MPMPMPTPRPAAEAEAADAQARCAADHVLAAGDDDLDPGPWLVSCAVDQAHDPASKLDGTAPGPKQLRAHLLRAAAHAAARYPDRVGRGDRDVDGAALVRVA